MSEVPAAFAVRDSDEARVSEGFAHLVRHGGPRHMHPQPYPAAPPPVPVPRAAPARNRGKLYRETRNARA